LIRWLTNLVRRTLGGTSVGADTGAASEIKWFQVSFNENGVRIQAQPLGIEPWVQEFRWDAVERICFRAEDLMVSDGIYVFTRGRPESYAIPTEATGGLELWNEILRRGLFDAELAIEAACSDGGIYCWPPPDQGEENR
jgi:hypothetical protein